MAEAAVVQYPPNPNALVPVRKGLIERFRQWFVQPQTSPMKVETGTYPFYLVQQENARVGNPGARTYRAWSVASPWVRAAIDIRRDQIAAAEWDIVPYRNGARYSKRLADDVRELFELPNSNDGSFQPFIQRVIEDVLVLDAGVVEKVRYPNGDIAELWPTPGDFIRVDARWDGSQPDKPRYFWYPDGVARAAFTNDDMLYIMANPRTIVPVGLSPLEILNNTIDSELQAMDYNRRMVMGAAPDGVLNIGESALPEDVQRARTYYETQVLGKSAMAIIGGFKSPSWMKFRDTNREMQFREWQDFLVRQIAVVFGLAPMDLGITFDVNRSTASQQGEMSEDRGLRPLMALMQGFFTREVVWDKSFGGKANNLKFVFTNLNIKESQAKANVNKIALGGIAWKTGNEARIDDGRPPIGDVNDEANIYNHVLMSASKGVLDLTTGEYLGEAQLAKIQADAKVDTAGPAEQEAEDANNEGAGDVAEG